MISLWLQKAIRETFVPVESSSFCSMTMSTPTNHSLKSVLHRRGQHRSSLLHKSCKNGCTVYFSLHALRGRRLISSFNRMKRQICTEAPFRDDFRVIHMQMEVQSPDVGYLTKESTFFYRCGNNCIRCGVHPENRADLR